MNLPDIYTRVVAKRPELAVKDLTPPIPGVRSYWLLPNFLADDTDGDSISAALILARWVEALPAWFKLSKQDNSEDPRSIGGVMWWVEDCLQARYEAYEPTPLEALAAFYLESNP